MANIALFPGSYKPPHIGHYTAAKKAAEIAGEVIVFVGSGERDGITQDMSVQLWKLYTQNDPNIEVIQSKSSPVTDVYDYVELKAKNGDIIYFIKGDKDANDPRFKNIEKYAEKFKKNITSTPINIEDIKSRTGKEISGRLMRAYIKVEDKRSFIDGLPKGIDGEQAWNIVTGLDEDLYDPNDHVLDYMKSSEWKAGMPDGHKDDIPRGYKYKRGGMYNAASGQGGAGTMYEAEKTGKILHAYDFDDTIAQVQANIKVFITSPDGDYNKEILIPASNFPEESKELEARLGSLEIKYDFSDFTKQIGDAIVNSKVVSKLKDSLSRPEVKTTILTARSIGHPVTRYLKSIGLDAYVVPLGLQVGGKVTGQDKANWIENHINKGYKTVYFIDDSEENRTAVAALQDKYPDVNLTVENPHTVSEKMSTADIDVVDTFADKQLDPVDVDLTSNHFFDRLNDPRNQKEISQAELIGFFKRLARKKDEFVEFLTKYKELVVHDNRTNINIPFMKLANKAIAKTVMRKKSFQTSSPKLALETKYGSQYSLSQHMEQIKLDHGPQQYRDLQTMMSQQQDEEVETWLKTKGYMTETKIFSQNWWKKQLVEVITETKANTHLTHLEELVLTQGQDGFNQAKSFLYELIKNLKGQDNSIKNVSVKWDGAPAVWAGINPENGQFFVGIKGIFNTVTPKINYTPQDIDKNHGHSGDLANKLKLALQYLPALGIKNILQGDFMFDSNDVKTKDIDGSPHYTFKPNTLTYAVEANSEAGKKILNAKIGVIWHTTYNSLGERDFSYGADVSGLSQTSNVWFDDAYFKDDTGILLSSEEEDFVLEKIKEADSLNVDYDNLPDELSSRAKTNMLNTYLNQEVRRGEFITDPNKSFERFKNWYQQAVDKSIEKVKRPESKERKKLAGEEKLKEFESKKDIVINLFKVSKLLSEAKNIFITKYDKAVATKHFIDNGDGTLSVTKAEGFVAVDHFENGIKLVDRLEFSKNNFNAGKPGAKK